MKIHIFYISIILVLLFSLLYFIFEYSSLSTMYKRNVDYCSEFSFAYGYSYALKKDINEERHKFHNRLEKTNFKSNVLSVEIWPAKEQWLFFANPEKISEGPGIDCSIGGKIKD